MVLSLPQALAIALACAPGVAPQTLLSIVQVESGFDPLAIGVNGVPRQPVSAATPSDAASQARALIASGRSVDLGLAQINSANLGRLGLTVEAAFDPCRNLAASAQLLQTDFGASGAETIGDQAALRATLSRYNTGDPQRGLTNGYVARVTSAANKVVPAIAITPVTSADALERPAPTPAPRPSWDVFGQAAPATFVLRVSTAKPGATR